MTKLRAPVRQLLSPRVDESSVRRIWEGVRARRSSLLARRRAVPGGRLILGVVLALICLVGARLHFRSSKPLALAIGPLMSRAGAALSVLGSDRSSNEELSDGSVISLEAGARLEVLENTSKSFVSVLRSGRGTFRVQPGGPRRWTIEAGLATIEVVGTRFSVSRQDTSVDVRVEHGVVLVRSELIRDRVQRLTEGQELSIRLPRAAVVPPTPVAPAPAVLPSPLAEPAARSSAAVPASSVTRLLEQAQDQRRRGDVQGAEASLRQALDEHPNSPQTALVAFTLGKLLLDAAGKPSEAARAFERCLNSAPPSALAEDALFRAAEARAQAGDEEAASARARQYLSRYPDGRHVRDVSRWIVER